MTDSTVPLFCCLDGCAKLFNDWQHHLIPPGPQRHRGDKLSFGEMLCIMVLVHLSPSKDCKHVWPYGLEQEFRHCFMGFPAPAGLWP